MEKQFKGKYNKSCIKIFKLLELLNNGDAEYEKVIEILSDNELPGSGSSVSVLINKYMNTLKVFGVEVKKKGSKYVLQKYPFSTGWDVNDLKIIKMMRSIQTVFANTKTAKDLDNLLNSIEEQFDNKTLLIYENLDIADKNSYDLSSELKSKIELCEKYCSEKHKVNIKFEQDGKVKTELCSARKVVYNSGKACLRVYKEKENELQDIEISKIIFIEQLPIIKYDNDYCATVIYTLKGRLAKAYKLKENEYLSKVNDDGSIVIVNKNEPTDLLLKRLIRYDKDCFINNPKSLRDKMKNLIDDILKNYDE